MYFIFDLTRAPCQCTVLINRVGSPEGPSLSPILFQQSLGSVQSRGEVLRLQVHCLEVSLCVWRCFNQQMQNTASKQSPHCAQECISRSIQTVRFLPAIPEPEGQSHIYYTLTQVYKIKTTAENTQAHTHKVTYSHAHTNSATFQAPALSSEPHLKFSLRENI